MNRTLPRLAAASLFTVAALAGAQSTGIAHPESLDDSISTAPAADHYRKPSATVTASPATVAAEPAAAPALHPQIRETPLVREQGARAEGNLVDVGTLLHVSLDTPLSTLTAKRGDHFTGRLTADIVREGRVIVPAGSIVRGRVTEVRASRHYLADAMMRLQPDTLTLPDGVPYPLSAQLIDFDRASEARYTSKITEEGEIVSDPHTKGRLAALGLTTGGATAAGAMMGGGVGAVVGATLGLGANAVLWARQDHQQRLSAGTILILDIDHPLLLNPTTPTTVISANTAGTE